MSAAYAVQVSEELALCSRFEFNIYSYDSDLVIGVEWRSRKEDEVEDEEKSSEKDKDTGEKSDGAKLEGLVKARVGVSKVSILLENHLIFNLSSLCTTPIFLALFLHD